MTTTPTTEYVTDVEHLVDCRRIDDRSALYLSRITHETQAAYFDDGEKLICAPDSREWEYEELMQPLQLRCQGCDQERYVAQDSYGDIVALTPENCPRNSRAYGHYINYDRKPCEYCGFTERRKS